MTDSRPVRTEPTIQEALSIMETYAEREETTGAYWLRILEAAREALK